MKRQTKIRTIREAGDLPWGVFPLAPNGAIQFRPTSIHSNKYFAEKEREKLQRKYGRRFIVMEII